MEKLPTTRKPSPLECLPVELIQVIFLYCLECNLPRASIYLHRALSHPTLYTWLIRLACSSDNPGAKHGFYTPDYLPRPLDFFSLSTGARADLQTAIYECKWFTLPLIRECQLQHIEHCLRQKCRNFEFSAEDVERLSNLNRTFNNACEPNGSGPNEGVLVFHAKGKTKRATADRQILIWLDNGVFEICSPTRIYTDGDVFRLPACSSQTPPRLPDRLLRPPWTESKLELLRVLASHAYIDEDNKYPRADRVMRRVIRSRDFTTFEKLAGIAVRTLVSKYPENWPLRRNHYQLALKYGDEKDDAFIKYLVDVRWNDIPNRDPGLKQALLARISASR